MISSSKPDYLLACPANSGTATYTTWANLPGSPGDVNWAAKEWVKQAVNGVYSATETQIVDGSWTDKGQFLHVKVIPMNSLIANVVFTTAPAYKGMSIRKQAAENFSDCYVTIESTVDVDDGVNTESAKASFSSLNFTYDPKGLPFWKVTP